MFINNSMPLKSFANDVNEFATFVLSAGIRLGTWALQGAIAAPFLNIDISDRIN
jgi:hypothetical protein